MKPAVSVSRKRKYNASARVLTWPRSGDFNVEISHGFEGRRIRELQPSVFLMYE